MPDLKKNKDMLHSLIHRPIAVSMCLIALAVIGVLSLRYIPISLMPGVDVPQITVQVLYPGASVHEVDSRATTPLRQQLMQVAGLKSIQSESRMDAGTIRMNFEPGSDMDLLFIEVNEKVDRAMGRLPEEVGRPKVMKASAMDIPAFYLNLTLKDEKEGQAAGLPFAGLGKFARDVVAKRIEQLPQTAMVDVSGSIGTEIECIPDQARMTAIGLTTDDIRKAIADNNITLGALSIVDGIYRYNIHFDSQILTKEDIENIYINHGGRLLQLREICTIKEKPAQRDGIVRSNGKNAVTMAVVKQNDAQMEDLQVQMDLLLAGLEADYPEIDFQLTRDQTRLLAYSISNLEANLLAGALLACIVLLLFMRDWRPTLLIVITIPLSLLITLLCFHLLHISINVISLGGLILGVGMMVDNSIIVIDNIKQQQASAIHPAEAVTKGTAEVFAPMLSSVLTTCSVFIPLIFLSGVTGALFYDQAIAVTIALFSSLAVSVLVIPVYYYMMPRGAEGKAGATAPRKRVRVLPPRLHERMQNHVFRHGRVYLAAVALSIPAIWLLFSALDKERMPYIASGDALMTIDWNAGISAGENDRRTGKLLSSAAGELEQTTVMAGVQQFLLPHTKELTSSETVVYVKAADAGRLKTAQGQMERWLGGHYPHATVEFSPSGNLYDLLFRSGESGLEIRLQAAGGGRPAVKASRAFTDSLRAAFPHIGVQPVVTEENLQYKANIEQMTLYKVTYRQLYNHLREAVHKNKVYEISEGSQSVPVMVGGQGKESREIISGSVKNSEGTDIPLGLLLDEVRTEDYKRLPAADIGEYYPIRLDAGSREAESIMAYTDAFVKRHAELSASYAGEYFLGRRLVGELTMVLAVSLALLFFILAAQFESIVQPVIILTEMAVDVCVVFLVLWLTGETLNIMSMTGLIVMSGIIINDSILKVDTINRLRRKGTPVLRAILTASHKRLRPILMTSLTTVLALLPFLQRGDMGSALQYPLSLTLVIGMTVGTLVSLFLVPLFYYVVYKSDKKKGKMI